jgi:SAM-dependent methyltransferase
VRVLDLGCAGGRNADVLAARGFDLHALDASPAMVEATRARVARSLGPEEATRRVVPGDMGDLSRWSDGTFQLVVALGVFHLAASEDDWYRALAEAARVTCPGGRCLVSSFAPGTGPLDAPYAPVAGTAFQHHSTKGGTLSLRDPAGLDADMRALGLEPEVATVVVEKLLDDRKRVTSNGRFVKRVSSGASPA